MEFSNEIKTFLKSLHPAGKTVGSADLVAKCHLIVTMNKAAWQRVGQREYTGSDRFARLGL